MAESFLPPPGSFPELPDGGAPGGSSPVVGEDEEVGETFPLLCSKKSRQMNRSKLLPVTYALLSMILYSLNGELLQYLQKHDGGEAVPEPLAFPAQYGTSSAGATLTKNVKPLVSPLFNLVLCHLGGLVLLPLYLLPSTGMQQKVRRKCEENGVPTGRVVTGAVVLSWLLMGYNYAWVLSARHLPVASVNACFQTSVAFSYLASLLFLEHPTRPSVEKLIAVLAAILGAMLTANTLSESGPPATLLLPGAQTVPIVPSSFSYLALLSSGMVLALLAALLNSTYQVTFKRFFGSLAQDANFAGCFLMLVGVVHVVMVLPFVVLANALGGEELIIPSQPSVVALLGLSAVIAMLVNLLWLLILMGGSPVVLSAAMGLSIPSTLLLDHVIHGASEYSGAQKLGCVLILAAFVVLTETHQVVLTFVGRGNTSGSPLPASVSGSSKSRNLLTSLFLGKRGSSAAGEKVEL